MDKIFVANGLLFKGDCVIVPQSLRKEILKIILEGHFGITRSFQFAKNSLLWPNMSNDVQNVVKSWVTCQEYSNNNIHQPLLHPEFKMLSWNKVGIGFIDILGKKYIEIALLNK